MAPLLRVSELQTHYFSFGGSRVVKAVDGVNFTLREGETIGLVGESGCGKTTTCLSVVGLLPPAARIVGGSIEFAGEELTTKRPREMRRVRGRQIAMILQDPMASLNPLFSIYWQVAEPAYHHQGVRGRSLLKRVQDLLQAVRIASPEVRMREYPHQMSGGMRQRVVGAIAMAGGPKLIIADEPTTALDVTTQAQILQEVRNLRDQTGTAFIWITHDLAVVSELADRIFVMYAGQIVETGRADRVLESPSHPYSKGLLGSLPSNNRQARRLPQIPGSAPRQGEVGEGCKFRPRCRRSSQRCAVTPELRTHGGDGSMVRCFHPVEDSPRIEVR